jgi:predicted small integral membrane protein
MIRNLKIFLVFLVALWGLIGAAGNLSHLGFTYDAVEGVTTMPWFPEGAGPPWRTGNPAVVWLGVALIVSGKLAALALCGWGTFALWRARGGDAETFRRAKRWAILGCGLAVAMLFGGFTVLGETMFLMFRDPEIVHAGEGAWRYGGFIALIMIFVAQED